MANYGLIVTVVLAAAGYFITYANSVRLENRKARLKYLSDQIQLLYGPLYSLSQTSDQAWKSFRSRHRPHGAYFGDDDVPGEADLVAWRLWMGTVFMPINTRMETVILENAHLIDGSCMPQSFIDLLAHVETYRAILKQWEASDFSEHTAYLNYPEELPVHVADVYARLTAQQARLLNSVR